MIGPSPRQAKLLGFIAATIERDDLPPSLVEMRRFLGCKSPTAPLDMLKSLEAKGYVTRRPRISRGTTLTGKARAFLAGQCG